MTDRDDDDDDGGGGGDGADHAPGPQPLVASSKGD